MQHQSYAYGMDMFEAGGHTEPVLDRWVPGWRDRADDLGAVSKLATTSALDVAWHVDRDAPPVLVTTDISGQRVDRARLSPSLQELWADTAGIGSWAFRGGSWGQWLTAVMLLADPGITCLLCITAQVAAAIDKYAPELRDRWLEPLTDGSAWGATWMTEVQGGTDLGANIVSATQDGDTWKLNGEKYFCSGAGLTDIAIVTARPEGAPDGARGIALFAVKRLRPDGTLNYRVERLKDKPATRAVPSGEIVFHDTEAHLIGKAEEGIYYTLENLTLSRLANAAGATGLLRLAQMEATCRMADRTAFGEPLINQPLIRRDLLELQLQSVGSLVLTYRAAAAFDIARDDTPPFGPEYQLARFWSHLAKLRTAEHAVEGTRYVGELFGGIGFVDDFAIARLHRESLVTAIWEGPANVQSLDLLESMHRKSAHEGFVDEVSTMLQAAGTEPAAAALATMQSELAAMAGYAPDEAQWHAKTFTRTMSDVAIVALLHDMAAASGESRWATWGDLYARSVLHGDELVPDDAADPAIWDIRAAAPSTTTS